MDDKKFYECWKYIEKKAFKPENCSRDTKNTLKWLRCLLLFFQDFYEMENQYPGVSCDGVKYVCENFRLPFISCTFSINVDLSGFSFSLKWDKTSLQFEYDARYKCEWDYINEPGRYRMNPDFNETELEFILENMIKHPAIHCHVFSELWNKTIPGDSLHEIRIGMPTKNPFLFLYQLSFQFLSIFGEQKKEKEFERLTGIIWEKKDEISISPGDLFDL